MMSCPPLQDARALRRTHGLAGTYPNVGVRPATEPDLSEEADEEDGATVMGDGDNNHMEEDGELQRELWRASRQGDVSRLSVRLALSHAENSLLSPR